MRWITFFILLYLMAAMQAANLAGIPHGASTWPRIDYLVILAVFYALFAGESAAPLCGLLCGIVYDLGNGELLGTQAIPLALVALLLTRVRLSIFREHFMSQLLMTLIAMLLFGVFVGIMHFVTSMPFEGQGFWVHVGAVAGNGIYSSLVAPLIFGLLFRFDALLGFSSHGPRNWGHN